MAGKVENYDSKVEYGLKNFLKCSLLAVGVSLGSLFFPSNVSAEGADQDVSSYEVDRRTNLPSFGAVNKNTSVMGGVVLPEGESIEDYSWEQNLFNLNFSVNAGLDGGFGAKSGVSSDYVFPGLRVGVLAGIMQGEETEHPMETRVRDTKYGTLKSEVSAVDYSGLELSLEGRLSFPVYISGLYVFDVGGIAGLGYETNGRRVVTANSNGNTSTISEILPSSFYPILGVEIEGHLYGNHKIGASLTYSPKKSGGEFNAGLEFIVPVGGGLKKVSEKNPATWGRK